MAGSGLWAGDQRVAPAPSITFQYVTAMAKGKKGGFALKAANAQLGVFQTLHEGKRPDGYANMNKQGAIILVSGVLRVAVVLVLYHKFIRQTVD